MLVLRGAEYSGLLSNIVPGTAAHTALVGATGPTLSDHRALLCEERQRRTDMFGRTILSGDETKNSAADRQEIREFVINLRPPSRLA